MEELINKSSHDADVMETIIKICAIMGEPNVDLDLLEKYCLKIGVSIKNKDGTFKSLDDLLMELSYVANS